MSSEVLSIFYSTIALSMATIIAFGGIFTIYRLQEINGEITRTRKSFKEYWRRRILYAPLTDQEKRTDGAENKRKKDSQEVNEWLDKDVFHILLSIPKIIDDNGLIDYFTQLNHQMNFKSKLYREIVFPTVLIVITFVASILSFLSLQDLNCNDSCNDSFYWIITLSCFAIFAFLEVIKYVNMAITEPPEEYINNALTESAKELRKIRITQIKDEIKKRIPIEEKKIKENLEKQIKKSNDADKGF